jgi:hypothetical protein
VLPGCLKRGTKIISNQGWINPDGAARRIVELLREHGAQGKDKGKKVAAVSGSLITDKITKLGGTILENGAPVSSIASEIISAEAYLGAEPIVEALRLGADIVITGRVADPSLFLAPMMHEFGWRPDDYLRLGAGSGLGHLLECGAQVTGGYFADPGFKVESDGSAVIAKVAGTGGAINAMTVKEQMLYEVHDPANYITPDVVVDFTTAKLEQAGPDRMRVSAISGKPRTPTLKVSMGCMEGFIGEDMFFYAGPGALRRAQLAKTILEERFRIVNLAADDLRIDFLGLNAIHGEATPADAPEPYEVAIRVAARCKTREEALKVGREIDGMAVSGVGMTGKRVPHQDRAREIIGVWSTLVPREAVPPTITWYES